MINRLAVVLAATVVVACARNARAEDTGQSVTIRCTLSSQDLFDGKFITIGDGKGTVALELQNTGAEELSIGQDIYIWVHSGNNKHKQVYVLNGTGLTDDSRRALLYTTFADYFTALDKGKIIQVGLSAWGQQFKLGGSLAQDYKGNWDATLAAQGKATIRQQLTTWPGSGRGWVATPVLTGNGSEANAFRVLGEFASDGLVENAKIVAMERNALAALAKDTNRPTGVRQWAVGWLAELRDDSGVSEVKDILKASQMPLDLRKSAARWLAIKHPATGLSVIDEVLWERTTDADLQKACYYAFDWALLPDANDPENDKTWEYIRRATGHPDAEISASAEEKVAEKK